MNQFAMWYTAAVGGRNLELSWTFLDLVCFPPAVVFDYNWLDSLAEKGGTTLLCNGAEDQRSGGGDLTIQEAGSIV